MKTLVVLWLVVSVARVLAGRRQAARYRFYDTMNPENARPRSNARRDGSQPERRTERLADCPFICSLHDALWLKKCAGSVVAPRWVLTAAHCVDRSLAYVTYNTSRPYDGGVSVDVIRTYRHDSYEVNEIDEGYGLGVASLRHDVGLVRVGRAMAPPPAAAPPLLHTFRLPPALLLGQRVQVWGFERMVDRKKESLISVDVTLSECDSAMSWYYCICGAARSGNASAGICALDSGGPVVLNGTMVGIVLMGPLECATRPEPQPGSASVFLSLYHYVDIVEATIHGLQDVPVLRSDERDPISHVHYLSSSDHVSYNSVLALFFTFMFLLL